MNNVVKNSKTSPKKSVTAKQLAKSNLTKRKNPDWDNLDRGYRYLTLDMKLPHDLAVAVMGNVVEESQGDYKATLKNGGGRGLIQWDGKKVPSGRYSLWGSIWASVAKPANVYDSTTDTVKNYWAPWGGLKGDKVRLKFIKAPIKEKARIYAESYLRPGKPRIADRQLSAMQLDSIYNPRIKDIIVLKDGGMLEFLKNGSGIHIKEENKGKFTSYCGGKVTNECILKGKNSSNPVIRKRATFADSARKWKHEDGGELIKKAQLGTQLPKAEDAAKRYKNGEFIKEFLNNNEGHAVILGVRTNKPFHNQGSIVRKINYRMGIPVDTTYIETPPSLLPVKKISRKATRYSNLKDNAYVGNLRQLYETLSNRYKTAMEVMRRKNGGILKAQYGAPLNLSSEDVLGGLRFLNNGLNKVLGVLNTPVAGSAPTTAYLPNGLLIEIPGTLGGAPEYLPGRLGRVPQLKNRAWLEKSNPIVDEGSLLAAKDWVQMLKELRGRIVKGGRPKGSKNIVKPKEAPVEPPVQKIETSYAQSGTSRERFLENRKMGISKRGRVSSNDRNARAMEAKGDARITNAGNYNLKKAQLQQVERNLNKYPKHEVEKFKNKTLLNMYRKGRSEADIQKATKEFYKYLANTYGYFKEGGILKAQLGTELTLFKDSENPNAVGGDIVNSYIRNQLMIPYLNKQKEDYEKWKLLMQQQSNTLKSSLFDNLLNTGLSIGTDYLKSKLGI